MKIGVLTYHKAINYGAYLQSYALTTYLRTKGYDAELIDFNMKCSENQYKSRSKNIITRLYANKKNKIFKIAQKTLPLSVDSLISDDIKEFDTFIKNKYDLIIVGSDEIWKIDSFRGFPNPYWLIDIEKTEKCSYAASSRSDFSKLKVEDVELIKNALREFKLIGVRDTYTYEEIERVIGSNEKLQLCCDPVFIYDFKIDKEKGKEILKKKYKINGDKPILGVMINDEKLANSITNKLKDKYELVALYRKWKGYKYCADLTPFEWINVIAALDTLVSNYFHGICFSILGNTKFVAVDSREKAVEHGKIYDLMNRNNCLSYFLSTTYLDYIDRTIELCTKDYDIDYEKIIKDEKKLGEKYFERLDRLLK